MYGTVSRLLYTNKADFTAKASFTTEASILVGVSPEANNRPIFPAGIFSIEQGGWGKAFRIEAAGTFGVLAATTPTYTFQLRLGTSTTWSASDTSILQSAAITTIVGVSNQQWRLVGNIICRTPGSGTGNCTLTCDGEVWCPTGFASPEHYCMAPSSGALATWTATLDGALSQYLGLSITCSSSDAANTITCKRLQVFELN